MQNRNTDNEQYKNLFEKLHSESQKPREVSRTYRLIQNPDEWVTPDPLLDILGLTPDSIAPQVKEVIEAHEMLANEVTDSNWLDFKWKLTALNELQDIFDSPLYPSADSKLNPFHLWYFYYESQHLLTESILCGFQGFYSASNALLRLYLESSVLQLYYYCTSNESQSYDRLEKFFKEGHHPSWHTALQKAVPKNAFCRPIKARLNFHYKGLSESAAHSYHPTFSPRRYTSRVGQASYEGVFFWQLTSVVIQAVSWAYFVNFPMLFHPCNIVEKFGFNGPVGILIDSKGSTAVKRSLLGNDFIVFSEYSAATESVSELTKWFDAFPRLTKDDILKTWNADDGDLPGSVLEGHARKMAKLRVTREMMATLSPEWTQDAPDSNDETDVFSYVNWKQAYKYLRPKMKP
jgi:hypothetical protein